MGHHQSQNQRIVKSLASKITAHSLVEDRCALVSKEVLLRLRLDILVAKHPSPPAACDDSDGEKEILLYSREQSHRTAHPRWDHIDEQIPNNSTWNSNKENAFARFVILDRDDDPSSSSTDDATKSGNNREWILAEIPLDPSLLRRLPATAAAGNDAPNGGSRNGNAMIIPHSLPPNTVLLHCDDGYTRVLPDLCRLLVRRGIVAEGVVDPVGRGGGGRFRRHGGADAEGRSSAFGERAFDVLGGSATIAAGVARDGNDDESDLVDAEDRVFGLLGKSTVAGGSNARTVLINQHSAKIGDGSVFDDRLLDLVGATASDTGSTATTTAQMKIAIETSKGGDDEPEVMPEENEVAESTNAIRETVDDKMHHPGLDDVAANEEREDVIPPLAAPSPLPVAQLLPLPSLAKDVSARTTKEEVEELRRLVRKEEQLLEEERQRVVQVGTSSYQITLPSNAIFPCHVDLILVI